MGIDTRSHRCERTKAVDRFIGDIKEIFEVDEISFEEEIWSSDDFETPEVGFNVIRITAKFRK